jgi:hypothetical protein
VFVVHDAGFLVMAPLLIGLAGGILGAAAVDPAGQRGDEMLPPGAERLTQRLIEENGLESITREWEDLLLAELDMGELIPWMFGVPAGGYAAVGTGMLLAAVDALSSIEASGALGEDGVVGQVDDAYFARGEIILLSSTEGSLVGTLNPSTRRVAIDAGGTPIMTATLVPIPGSSDCRSS